MRISAIFSIGVISVLTAYAQDQTPAGNRANVITVEGNVKNPGTYPVSGTISMNTVVRFIAEAGGLVRYADHTVFIIRVDDQSVTHSIEVPLWDIVNRKKPDIALQAGDILRVPNSPRRQIQKGLPQIDPPSVSPPINPRPV